jgi:hypothetical protein
MLQTQGQNQTIYELIAEGKSVFVVALSMESC